MVEYGKYLISLCSLCFYIKQKKSTYFWGCYKNKCWIYSRYSSNFRIVFQWFRPIPWEISQSTWQTSNKGQLWWLGQVFQYGYGSIPINTIFRGMNIHLPAILMFTRGTRFWHTAISERHGSMTGLQRGGLRRKAQSDGTWWLSSNECRIPKNAELVHPSCTWINPTYPIETTRVNLPLPIRGMTGWLQSVPTRLMGGLKHQMIRMVDDSHRFVSRMRTRTTGLGQNMILKLCPRLLGYGMKDGIIWC